ncbi:hypothetical protein X975_07904, partial [Stegodyphus mimosarum]
MLARTTTLKASFISHNEMSSFFTPVCSSTFYIEFHFRSHDRLMCRRWVHLSLISAHQNCRKFS